MFFLKKNSEERGIKGFFKNIADLYIDGFRSMTVGRSLWKIILIKLFIMFAILKLFFFPDVMKTHFSSDQERAEHVANLLTTVNNR